MRRYSRWEFLFGWLSVLAGAIIVGGEFFAPLLCTSDGSRCISEFASMDRGAFAFAFAVESLPVLVIGVAATFDSIRHQLGAQLTVWIASLFTLFIGVLSAASGGFLLALPALFGILAAAMGLMCMDTAPQQAHEAHQ